MKFVEQACEIRDRSVDISVDVVRLLDKMDNYKFKFNKENVKELKTLLNECGNLIDYLYYICDALIEHLPSYVLYDEKLGLKDSYYIMHKLMKGL